MHLKYIVLFLVVVIVGGEGSFGGSFVAAMALGIIDTLGKYFVAEAAPYLLYAAVFALLAVAAEGPLAAEIGRMIRRRTGPGLAAIGHALPWAIAIVYFYAAPDRPAASAPR